MIVSFAPRKFASLGIVLLGVVPVSLVMASNPTIRFTNTEHPPINLVTDVVVDETGNLRVECEKLLPGDTTCKGIGTTTVEAGTPPVLTFTASTSTIDLGGTGTKAATLTWSTTPAAAACVGSGNAAALGLSPAWGGPRTGAGSGNTAITHEYSAAGAYEYSLTCYNDDGASNTVTRTVTVSGSTPVTPQPTDGCAIVKANIVDATQRAQFQPDGFAMQELSWANLFPGTVYPNDKGEPYPVGSWTISQNRYSPATTMKGRYITIPFVGNGNPYSFGWTTAKPLVGSYQPARVISSSKPIFVSLSTCKGDFRVPGTYQYVSPDPTNDPTFRKQCRSSNISEAWIYYGPTSQCPVESGKTYYLNVIFADPADGYDPAETSCSSSTGVCEISLKHTL